MRISEEFLKVIEEKGRAIILNKLNYFAEAIINSNCLQDIPKGLWIRKIIGTDVYKFRVNNGDRILFTFDDNRDSEIVFLKYCNHDSQIQKGKIINDNLDLHLEKSLELNLNSYEEDDFNESIKNDIEEYINRYLSIGLDSLTSIVLEDEYIVIALEEDEYLYYLNENQFECLKVLGKPIIISGCAGSGKTMIGIHKLILNNELNIKSAYITYSSILKSKANTYFDKFKKGKNSSIDFICLNDYCAEILGIDPKKIIKYSDFEKWFLEMSYRFNDLSLSTMIIYNEINNINTYKDNYKYEGFKDKEIEFIKNIYAKYEDWININGYIDEIRLIEGIISEINDNKIELSKYDFIFVDEVQDLRNNHLKFIYNMSNIKENIVFAGDINQIINNSNFDFKFLKSYFYENNICYDEKFLNKNYRNCSGVVDFINKLIDLRINNVGKLKSEYDLYEDCIREGKKPYIIPYKNENIQRLVEEVNERDYCAIVVPTYVEKHKLIIEGANEGRVFTVEEIKGLEYKNIFCINFISTYKNYWKLIKKGANQGYLRHFINILYVAITRGINIVGFVEKDINMVKNLFGKESVEDLKGINLELLEMLKITTTQGWLKEGRRLEEVLNYGKAYYAYKKANDQEGMFRCKKRIEKIRGNLLSNLFGKQNETSIRIENSTGPLSYNDVFSALHKIFSKHFVYTKGNVDVVFQGYDFTTQICTVENVDIHNAIAKISEVCKSCIESLGNIKKHKVTIHMNLLYNDIPMRLENLQGEEINLIRVEIFKSNKNSNSMKMSYEYLETLNFGNAINKAFNEYGEIDELESSYYEFDDTYIQDIVNNLVKQANRAISLGKNDEAIHIYKIILNEKFEPYISSFEKDKDIMTKLYNIGKVLGITIDGIEDFKNYLIAELNNNLGRAYINKMFYDEAYECLKKAIEIMPTKYPNAYLTMGDIFMSKYDYDEAKKYFEQGLKLGDKRAYKGIGLVNRYNGEFVIAMDYINKFLDEFPMDIDGHIKRVETFVMLLTHKNDIDYSNSYSLYFKYANDSNNFVRTYAPHMIKENKVFEYFISMQK